ncbi:amino acid transporter [Morchella conica CCBAS932]|uniref:Amino acid transporter n=1 Tax=Morchella conica CCBAS932 TaxID=1392247 RepID=A0A3N4KZH0_9PEZI|nr:amino acid transporter [Morchella conica CCBAS932]
MVDSDKIEVGAGDDYLELGQRQAGSARMTPEDRDPFGNEGGNDIKFKTMTWWQTAMIMIAETISLGILSLPSVLKAVGLVPGCILIIGLGIIATYTGYVLGQFKLRYPQVHTFAEAGEIIMGGFGRELFATAQVLFLVFVMGSHILTFSIMLNVVTGHGACTIVFTICGFLISLICTFPRTMKSVSYLSIGSFASILGAVFITMIGVGVSDGTPFYLAFGAVSNIIFAYAGHLAFFSFISEMKDPRDYPKALCALQISDTILYLTAAVVIYRYTGEDVTSPALSSSTKLLEKIAYGIAIPTIVIAGVINGHVAAKYIYVRIFRGSDHLGSRSWYATFVWLGIITVLWVVAWIIASAVPIFNNLLGLISALFVSWFTYGVSGWFWIHMNRGKLFLNKKKTFLTIVNVAIMFMGGTIMVCGLYASGKAIHDDQSGKPFSCADNSV